jgi:molybdate transport system substrate-binding protein
VAVSTSHVMDELVKGGKLVAATRTELARAGVGLAVRAGAPKPDISSADALKRALLNAKSVAYAKDGTGGLHFHSVLERLGISKQMAPKLQHTAAANPADGATTRVARGDAEIAVATVSALFVPGVDVVGPLPGELQTYIQFSAAVGAAAREPQAAAAFIKFVTSSAAGSAFKAKGMEPAPQR